VVYKMGIIELERAIDFQDHFFRSEVQNTELGSDAISTMVSTGAHVLNSVRHNILNGHGASCVMQPSAAIEFPSND